MAFGRHRGWSDAARRAAAKARALKHPNRDVSTPTGKPLGRLLSPLAHNKIFPGVSDTHAQDFGTVMKYVGRVHSAGEHDRKAEFHPWDSFWNQAGGMPRRGTNATFAALPDGRLLHSLNPSIRKSSTARRAELLREFGRSVDSQLASQHGLNTGSLASLHSEDKVTTDMRNLLKEMGPARQGASVNDMFASAYAQHVAKESGVKGLQNYFASSRSPIKERFSNGELADLAPYFDHILAPMTPPHRRKNRHIMRRPGSNDFFKTVILGGILAGSS